MQLLKTDNVSNKPQKPAPVPGPPDAPPASSLVSTTAPAGSASLPPSVSQPPQASPVEAGHGLKEQQPPLVEGTGAKEEYGYIVTNQRSALDLIEIFSVNGKLVKSLHAILLT